MSSDSSGSSAEIADLFWSILPTNRRNRSFRLAVRSNFARTRSPDQVVNSIIPAGQYR
ncbi:hypothetical protein AB0F91_34685 [Amycolatopsis sp. NPDC023774]|uniref:hypothetical protein n=1 Tax=Amycolatopsis sp. NPDC023774 TaxID=3155015 RepID=UPI003409FCD7